MAHIKPPHIPEEPPAVLSDDELKQLLKACGGRTSTRGAMLRSSVS
jgi:hypothetical protein